jgi:small subunit ribosomal protein S16
MNLLFHPSKKIKGVTFMSVKIRLARHGAKKAPYYRVVVADSRKARNGRLIEEVGRYNPTVEPTMIKLDLEKIDKWIANGAQPTDTVARLIETARKDA